jgi:hypothetical protein
VAGGHCAGSAWSRLLASFARVQVSFESLEAWGGALAGVAVCARTQHFAPHPLPTQSCGAGIEDVDSKEPQAVAAYMASNGPAGAAANGSASPARR